MKNLTIRVDETTLCAARVRAVREGTSVNAVLREAIEEYAHSRERARLAMEKLLASAEQARAATAGKTRTRDELHDR